MTDRLSLTNALADATIDRQKAERIATEIFDAVHENVATRQDLHNLEAALKAGIERLGARIDQVKTAFRGEIAAVRAEMRELELRLEARIDRVVVRLGSLIVVLVGVVLAAIRYLPHS